KGLHGFIPCVGPSRSLVPGMRSLPGFSSSQSQGSLLQGVQLLIVGAGWHDGDAQSCSCPSLASRRTFPPVGPTWIHPRIRTDTGPMGRGLGAHWPPPAGAAAPWEAAPAGIALATALDSAK